MVTKTDTNKVQVIASKIGLYGYISFLFLTPFNLDYFAEPILVKSILSRMSEELFDGSKKKPAEQVLKNSCVFIEKIKKLDPEMTEKTFKTIC